MITLAIDNASMAGIISDIKRLQSASGKSTRLGAEWAGVNIIKSLGAQTRIGKKKRAIVTQTIDGVSRKGVMMWRGSRSGQVREVFTPIDTAKDVPVKHFVGKNGNKLVRLIKTGKVITETEFKSMSQAQLARNASIVFIRMAGLAKKSWRWMQRRVERGGNANDSYGGKRLNVGSISWFGQNLTIHNRLSYIVDALTSKEASVNVAIQNGAKSFKWKVDQELAKLGLKTQ
jgi:hypothetical protein